MPARPRFIDYRTSLGPEAVGKCATDVYSLMAIVNEAQERLILDPTTPDEGWWSQSAKLAFTVSRDQPFITTPQEVARIVSLDVCKRPIPLRNQWYEFLEFGPGYQPNGCGPCLSTPTNPANRPLAACERETVTTFAPLLPGGQYIRAYATDPADVGRTALIQGKDSNGQVVRYLDALSNASGLGEKIIFSSPFTDTTNAFTETTGIQKQKTYGEVQFFQVDSASGTELPLLVMAPGETTASYRKYYISGLPLNCCSTPQGEIQVLAMCRLDFVPVACDADYLSIANVPALIDETMSIRLGRVELPASQQMSVTKHANALRILNAQLDLYLGKTQTAVQRHIFGSDRMRLQPL